MSGVNVARRGSSNLIKLRCLCCGDIFFVKVTGTIPKGRVRRFCAKCNRRRRYIKRELIQPYYPVSDLIRSSNKYLQTRNLCFKRDNYESVLSHKKAHLQQHHITPLSEMIDTYGITRKNWQRYLGILTDPDNVVTLTSDEHKLFHITYGEEATAKDFEIFRHNYERNNSGIGEGE